MGVLLAPYDDSMRLGQGYNSFLQTPCMYDAVDVPSQAQSGSSSLNKSQTVSYSSHIINRISEVARSMGISTGSTVKNGSIALAGNASSIDESKFAESHLNIVVSVKVLNPEGWMMADAMLSNHGGRRPRHLDKAKFIGDKAEAAQKISKEADKLKKLREVNKEFHEIYGDSYISGFIEGGDLHGVVSIKVIDSTKKEEVKAQITRDINSSDPADMRVDPSFLASTLETRLQGCETTIAVNWSGGGQIKSDDEEWSLDSLFRVAAAFPAQVAACPRRTWAVLTSYSTNGSFLGWSIPIGIEPYDFHGVSAYAADLLDTYMAYKNNVRLIQAVLDSPRTYMRSPGKHPIDISVGALVEARKDMKKEMSKIMEKVDTLNDNPGGLTELEESQSPETENGYKPNSPEEWATRLPILRGLTPRARDALGKFALLDGEFYSPPDASSPSALGRPGDPPAEKLFEEATRDSFTKEELEALEWELNRRILKRFIFVACPSKATNGNYGRSISSDRLRNELRMNAVFADRFGWPSKVHLSVASHEGNIPRLKFKFLFTKSEVPRDFIGADLADNERIRAVRIGKTLRDNKEIISYVRVQTTNGSEHSAGNTPSQTDKFEDFKMPSSCSGLLGFVVTARHEDSGAVGRLVLAWK